jgi:hypothetical protein
MSQKGLNKRTFWQNIEKMTTPAASWNSFLNQNTKRQQYDPTS